MALITSGCDGNPRPAEQPADRAPRAGGPGGAGGGAVASCRPAWRTQRHARVGARQSNTPTPNLLGALLLLTAMTTTATMIMRMMMVRMMRMMMAKLMAMLDGHKR